MTILTTFESGWMERMKGIILTPKQEEAIAFIYDGPQWGTIGLEGDPLSSVALELRERWLVGLCEGGAPWPHVYGTTVGELWAVSHGHWERIRLGYIREVRQMDGTIEFKRKIGDLSGEFVATRDRESFYDRYRRLTAWAKECNDCQA